MTVDDHDLLGQFVGISRDFAILEPTAAKRIKIDP